ncbi:NAD(P)/FAD-dependent oxidoreductase [Gallaecimonas mangrovi]|uniref:NAD(P)/FAD-dependent oxidoreductase n=1 Tax=Gallaecimonas mangrovi TaxID=2291597 RepID=UPI000E2030C7|nr:FAD-dependent monooxygenase [Gallaecimonas mangrovi]
MPSMDKRDAGSFDVVVVGGGPAGTTAALTLLKEAQLKVLVLERKDYSMAKPGEVVLPNLEALLHYLDVWQRFTQEQPEAHWHNTASSSATGQASTPQPLFGDSDAWLVNRTLFDAMLAEKVTEHGGQIWAQANLRQLTATEQGWQLTVSHGLNESSHIRCRYVIDAAGRASPWAQKATGTRVKYDNLLGLAATLPAAPSAPRSIVENCEYGWWYSQRQADGQLLVSLMTDVELVQHHRLALAENWLTLLSTSQQIAKHLYLPSSLRAPRAFPAYSSLFKATQDAPIVATGDAVASYDPLSSSGIYHALDTGMQAAYAVIAAMLGDTRQIDNYYSNVARDFSRYTSQNWRIYRQESRWPQSDFWRFRTAQPSLTPDTIVCSGEQLATASLFVPTVVARRMQELATIPKPAHRVVAGLREESPDIPVKRILLAMEELLVVSPRSA